MNKYRLQKKLTLHILTRFIIAFGIYAVIIVIAMFAGIFISSQFTWYGSSLLYRLLKIIDYNKELFILFMLGIGFIVIFIYYWLKTLSYLEKVINATKSIYQKNDDLIVLPDELKEVENQINQIRMDVVNNERAAKEAERRKNDLVVYLAHDLKTPLTSVIGYLTLLRDELQISEELREKYLSISLEKAERLEDLINEFFEITRFNLTNLTLDLSKVNLTRMLEQILFEFRPLMDEKEIGYSLIMDQDIYVIFDVNKMQRVFDNLLRNAINYSFEKSVIEINVVKVDTNIIFTIKNHGFTIPEEKLERIFEQFYRLDTARTSKTGGVGLGLAIAKEIVSLHKGSISVASKDDIIIFELVLPVRL